MLSTVSRDNLKHEERIYWGLFFQQSFFSLCPIRQTAASMEIMDIEHYGVQGKGDVALRLWAGNKVGLGDLGGLFQGQGSWDHMG